ncbi:MAG: monovalent cation/H(+) antiporter subunit G [Rhodobacter sp.]|jgi:multicomponent Na+:H+ antiporter subunit G|nr:monovalent cation/H(+) antiporter subunit G [Rhodobacter sp.]
MTFLEALRETVSWVLILSGGFFTIVGAFGIWRFRDFWARLHAASITDSAGMILMMAGMCVQAGFTLITVKLIIIGVFLFITGPTATHAVANAALVSGRRPTEAPGLTGTEPQR